MFLGNNQNNIQIPAEKKIKKITAGERGKLAEQILEKEVRNEVAIKCFLSNVKGEKKLSGFDRDHP